LKLQSIAPLNKQIPFIYVITYILKLYEPIGVVVTQTSLSTDLHADYLRLILSVLEEQFLMMATSGGNM
jgi:hypothetical protein